MWNNVFNRPLLQGQSALHLAVMAGQLRAVRWMLRRGANPDDRDLDGCSALHCAAMHPRSETAIALLELLTKADLGVDTRDTVDGGTALHIAAFFGHMAALRWLLDHGATVDCRDDLGRTPLMRALCEGELAAAKVLLQHGANANACDDRGEPVLLQGGGDTRHVTLLLTFGLDVQQVDGEGRNLLHLSAMRGDGVLVRWALEQGVDPTQRDVAGLTPLHALELELLSNGALPPVQTRFESSFDFDLEQPFHAEEGIEAGLGFESQPDFESQVQLEVDDNFGATLTLLRRHQAGPLAYA